MKQYETKQQQIITTNVYTFDKREVLNKLFLPGSILWPGGAKVELRVVEPDADEIGLEGDLDEGILQVVCTAKSDLEYIPTPRKQ